MNYQEILILILLVLALIITYWLPQENNVLDDVLIIQEKDSDQ